MTRSAAALVLFDLDGVLVDSSRAVEPAAALALASVGAPPASDLSCLYGPPLVDGFERLLIQVGGDPAQAERCVVAYRRRYEADLPSSSHVYDGIEDVLRELGRRSRMIVATTKPRRLAEPLLRAMGIRAAFELVVGPDSDLDRGQKAEIVAAALGATAPGCAVMVGDCKEDVIAAHANGIACVGALWGYGREAELVAVGVDGLAASPGDLPLALRRTGGSSD